MDVSVEGSVPGQAVDRRWLTVPRSRVSRLLYGGVFLWGVLFAVGVCLKQHFFLLGRYDLGNFTQALWSTAHGHLLQVTEVGGEQVSRLGIHVDPIILGLLPLWWIWPSPDLLIVVQVAALAAGAIPLYWLGRKHLKSEGDAALISAAYLICPVVAWNALHGFDAVALAVPLLFACIWFLDENRLWPFAVTALLVVLCQEQMGLIVASLGAVYGWRTRRWVPAAVIAVLGLGVTAFDLRVVLPHFSGGGVYASRLAGVGGSVSGVLTMSVAHPLTIGHRVVGAGHLFGLALLFAPVLFLCFRSVVMVAAAPQLAFVLLSARIADVAPWSQNLLPIVPFVFAGTVYVLRPRSKTPKWRAGHVLVASLGCAAFFGPLSPWLFPSASLRHVAAERQAVGLVPRSAVVSTTNHLGAHLASRRFLYVFPVLGKATWVVLDEQEPQLPNMEFLRRRHGSAVWTRDLVSQPELMTSEIRRLEADPRWTRVFSSDGVMVFTRRSRAASAR
jgi:uncharacterized membrane protein